MYYSIDIEGAEDPWKIDFGVDDGLVCVSSVSAEARDGMAKPLLQETSSIDE